MVYAECADCLRPGCPQCQPINEQSDLEIEEAAYWSADLADPDDEE